MNIDPDPPVPIPDPEPYCPLDPKPLIISVVKNQAKAKLGPKTISHKDTDPHQGPDPAANIGDHPVDIMYAKRFLGLTMHCQPACPPSAKNQ